MNIKDFKAGSYKSGYQYEYFVPGKINHSFVWEDKIINELLETASLKLGELNSFSKFVPDTDMFIRMHVIKEAVVSSKIEGTKTNIEEALADEKDVIPEKRNDWLEVNNYVNAINSAIESLKTLPISNRLIKETHRILLSEGRGDNKTPGEFRKSQNWIGGTTLKDAVFIPPAHEELPDLLSDFERFINNEELSIPHLVKIAIAHYQFETIHPFLDGNGRIGRLLITLYFVANGIMEKPLLYLSDFFEKNKTLYYDNLTFVRTRNDLAQWIKYFLTGIIATSEKAVNSLKEIVELKAELETKYIVKLGNRSKQGFNLLNHLFTKPIVSIKDVQTITNLTPRAATNLVNAFVKENILMEITGNKRNRVFAFNKYLRMFN
ncbi:MAG: Fic family protein [Melioribacteraceae bacterium]|nr:Fic family protein [Melioribacteraceae bacterium]